MSEAKSIVISRLVLGLWSRFKKGLNKIDSYICKKTNYDPHGNYPYWFLIPVISGITVALCFHFFPLF